ncbi:hypothetical protein ABT075_01965 [Streptomyces sp. NPDC002677]
MGALLHVAGLVDDQRRGLVVEVLDDVLAPGTHQQEQDRQPGY